MLAGLLLAALVLETDVFALSFEGHTESIRSYSVLHSDGSIERSVVQPMNFTAEAARSSDSWEQSDRNRSRSSFKARGRFDSVDRMPAYYEYYGGLAERRAGTGHQHAPSTLERRYSRIDHVFATEHQWQEQLKHGSRLDEMVAAFHQAMEWNFTLQKGALLARLRPEYDATPYLEWYRSELVPIAEELLLLRIEGAVGGKQESDRLKRASRLKLQQFREQITEGAAMQSPEDGDEESEDWFELLFYLFSFGTNAEKPSKLFMTLLTSAPGRIIRRTDGRPLDLATPESVWKEDADAALKEFIKDNYPDEEALSWKMMDTMQSVLGPYVCVLCDGYDFLFTLSMPGYIVDTNGNVRAEHEVAWSFDEHQVYPFGYRMRARSLEPDLQAQQTLTGWQPIKSRQELLEFTDALSREPRLKEKLEESRDAGRLLAEASFKLGEFYHAKKSPRMWFWYCHAASQGHARTLYYLASWYAFDTVFSRIGMNPPAAITRDGRAAYVWYAIAEDNGLKYASENKQIVFESLTPRKREEAKQMLEAWTPDQCPWPGS